MQQLSQQTRQFPSWETDNRCPPYEMFMMSASLNLPGAMRLTGWSQPVSCSWLHFHYLRFYLRIYQTARRKWKNSVIPRSFFGAWLKLIIPLAPFFDANLAPSVSACFVGFDVRFWMSRALRNEGCQTNARWKSCNDTKWHNQAACLTSELVCHPGAVVCGVVDLSRKHKPPLAASKIGQTKTTARFPFAPKGCLG